MKQVLTCILLFACVHTGAQRVTAIVEKGNQEYRKKQFGKAATEYDKALKKDAANLVARFNQGNAQQRLKKYKEAAGSYETVAANSNDPAVKAKAYYNQGLAYVRQNKLPEAVEAFKQSLRLVPNDGDTRENLQKAMQELKLQQSSQSEQQEDKNKKKPKDKKQSKPSGARLSKEEAEKMLNNLGKEEKNLQKEVQKKNQSARQLKDW